MITSVQINQLMKQLQIDKASVLREYIQLLVLNQLYQHKEASEIYFKGGTAIRLMFRSARFSEDLDFSTELGADTITNIVTKLINDLKHQLFHSLPISEIAITKLYKGKDTQRFRLSYRSQSQKYPITVRLDFNKQKLGATSVASGVTTQYPIVFIPVVMHMSAHEILADKIHAIYNRSKGRDIYDLWFLLSNGNQIDQDLIATKLGEKFSPEKLSRILTNFPIKELRQDLNPFLPSSQRAIISQLPQLVIDQLQHSKLAAQLFHSLPNTV